MSRRENVILKSRIWEKIRIISGIKLVVSSLLLKLNGRGRLYYFQPDMCLKFSIIKINFNIKAGKLRKQTKNSRKS